MELTHLNDDKLRDQKQLNNEDENERGQHRPTESDKTTDGGFFVNERLAKWLSRKENANEFEKCNRNYDASSGKHTT
jgi:hypothetical protein